MTEHQYHLPLHRQAPFATPPGPHGHRAHGAGEGGEPIDDLDLEAPPAVLAVRADGALAVHGLGAVSRTPVQSALVRLEAAVGADGASGAASDPRASVDTGVAHAPAARTPERVEGGRFQVVSIPVAIP